MATTRSLDGELAAVLAAEPRRAGSLAITVFGDVVSQQGGAVWLGSLVELLGAFGLNERQVRTAIFRLAREGWLVAEQHGRRRYYALSALGQRLFARAAVRIYAAEDAAWNGEWTLVMAGNVAPEVRDELRKRLSWQGFGVLGSGLLAHPRADAAVLEEIFGELAVNETVVVWHARTADEGPLRALVRAAWQLEDIADRFATLVARYEPLARQLEGGARCSEAQALLLRCLLVHDYRRILLRTIDLPAELLPGDWPGSVARDLVARIYRLVHARASVHASACLRNVNGPLPAPAAGFYQRCGGLVRAAEEAARAARARPALESC
jgi:phenylacetic acid degradation operon negative regulatory protein